jgi:hypothetical protein
LFFTFQKEFFVGLILFYPIKERPIQKTNSLAAIAVRDKYNKRSSKCLFSSLVESCVNVLTSCSYIYVVMTSV